MEMSQKQVVVDDSKPLTTFVQVDSKTFKEVVQRLTGPSEATPASEPAHEITTAKGNIRVKKPEFKLHERRQYKGKLENIKPPLNFKQGGAALQQHFQEQPVQSPEQLIFSPSASGSRLFQSSPVSTPSTCFSGLSLMERESKGESAIPDLNAQEEEKAIKERRFYLHPSPRSKPGFTEPELLSLFPIRSPKATRDS